MNILEKIQKLLRLASNNTNQAEMESAMAKAIEIATLNNIDIASIDINKGEKKREEVKLESQNVGGRLPITNDYVSTIVQKYFNVRIILGGNRALGRKIYFVGIPSDIEMAKFVSSFLGERFMSLWHTFHKKNNCGISSRESFFMGLYNGLSNKLEERKTRTEQEAKQTVGEESFNQYALMVVDRKKELQNAVSKYFPDSRKEKPRYRNTNDSSAYQSGVSAGYSLNIARPIGN